MPYSPATFPVSLSPPGGVRTCDRCRVAYAPAWEPVFPDLVRRDGREQEYGSSVSSMLYTDICPHCGGVQNVKVSCG